MENSDSTTSDRRIVRYLDLLQGMNTISNFTSHWNESHFLLEETSNISEIETIFNDVAENIEEILDGKSFEINRMFLISLLNLTIRFSAIDESGLITSQTPFQSMFEELKEQLLNIPDQQPTKPALPDDMLDSLLLNLIKDEFIDICFKRIFSNKTETITDCVTSNEEELSQANPISFIDIVIYYMDYITDLFRIAVIHSPCEFIKNNSSLMISIQLNINTFMMDGDKDFSQMVIEVIINTLGCLWNMAHRIPLSRMFIETGYIPKLIEWIRTDTFASNIVAVGVPIFAIINNLSKNKTALKLFHTEKAFDVLMERKQLVEDADNSTLTQYFGQLLISLATSDEQSEEMKKRILDTSVTFYGLCQMASEKDDLRSRGGYHLSELLELLYRAFSNTYVIKHILDNEINEDPTPIHFFAQLFLTFYGVLLDPEPNDLEENAVNSLLKIFLQICSYSKYSKELAENTHFRLIIEGLAKRVKQDHVQRIWSNIERVISTNESKVQTISMIYVSYDTVDKVFCKEFVTMLRNQVSIPIWVDYEKVESSNDIWEHSSSIIKSATVLLALVSTAYAESADKAQELSYIISTVASRDTQKRLIIVKVEPNFRFDRSWMKDLLRDRTIISYEKEMKHMVSGVSKEIIVSKRKPLIRCLPCPFKSSRKKTNNFSENTTHKSVSTADSNLASETFDICKEPPNTTDDSTVFLATKRPHSYTLVSGLIDQTGSTDYSSWV